MSALAAVSPQAWCTFRLGAGHYGIELSRVQEVLRPLTITRHPLAPPGIAGLTNLRGRIVTVVDLRAVLGAGAAPDAAAALVVVRSAEGAVALLVDAIGDVRRVGAGGLAPSLAAEPVRDDAGSLVARTWALPGELLVELDLDRVLERAFFYRGEARP